MITLEEIKKYLFADPDGLTWEDLLPSYQKECVLWLYEEVVSLKVILDDIVKQSDSLLETLNKLKEP